MNGVGVMAKPKNLFRRVRSKYRKRGYRKEPDKKCV